MLRYMLLTFLHYRLAWWPLHPVGLAVASTWMVQADCLFGFSWPGRANALVLRFGDVGLYQRLKPLFHRTWWWGFFCGSFPILRD